MSILDIFKKRRRLIAERDYAWGRLDMLRSLITGGRDVDVLRRSIAAGKDIDPPRMLLTESNLIDGVLTVQHWGVRAMAESFFEYINSFKKAENYITTTFFNDEGYALKITIQRAEGISPEEKLKATETRLHYAEEKVKAQAARLVDLEDILARAG